MPKSKQRKQHKQKVQQFQQRNTQAKNKVAKQNQQMYADLMQYYQQHYKDYVIEVAYKQNPELLIKQENGYLLNEEKVKFVDNILVWNDSNEPVLSSVSLQTSNVGEAVAINPSEYTEEVIYGVLKTMFERHEQQASESEDDIIEVEAEVIE